MHASFYPAHIRVLMAVLHALSVATLFVVLLALVAPTGAPVNPLGLIRTVVALCLLPGLAVRLIRHAHRGRVYVDADRLILDRRDRLVEIPVRSIAAIEPWRVPLPGSGVGIRLASGHRWNDGIETPRPAALLATLIDGGAPTSPEELTTQPNIAYAEAARPAAERSWRHDVLKFPAFALVPTLPLFRVHQVIAYGGTFGEYYQYGLGAYLAGFAVYWATLTIYLMVYAAALRLPTEVVTIVTAVFTPSHAPAARRTMDRLAELLYYLGVPAVVALRFVPW